MKSKVKSQNAKSFFLILTFNFLIDK